MSRFRKKPVEVEAFQMTRERRPLNEDWPEWLLQAWNKSPAEEGSLFCSGGLEGNPATPLFIRTLEGVHRVSWNDWIIRGVKGELYPCKPGIFAETYEAV